MFHKIILAVVLTLPLSAFASKAKKAAVAPSKTVDNPMVDEKPEAKPQIFMVEGMHCDGCVETIKKSVCKENKYASCNVLLVDEKKQIGEIRIVPNPGQIIDMKDLRAVVKDAGYTLKK